MKFVLRALVPFFLITVFSVTKQAIVKESCDYFGVSPAEEFDADKYLGKWYVYFLYDYEEVKGQDCIRWLYGKLKGNTSYVLETSKNLRSGKSQSIRSEMVFDKKGYGQYTYDIKTDTTDPEFVIVISTDYYNYAVEWSCLENEDGTECFVYVITRKPIPEKKTIKTINDVVKKHKIDLTLARYIKQGPECGKRLNVLN